ncbi:MAG: hypothetical protein JNM93_13390 [Bacteriovoracaceae bacterium]|nr:hypothetical protein [Bacteriovoracaceae bacterium]
MFFFTDEKKLLKGFLILTLVSCNQLTTPTGGSQSSNFSNINSLQGKVLTDNPVILADSVNVSLNINLNSFQSGQGVFITSNNFLDLDCSYFSATASDCIQISNDENDFPGQRLTKNEFGHWGYDGNSPEFLQVNAYYHSRLAAERMSEIFEFAWNDSMMAFAQLSPFSSFPNDILPVIPLNFNMFWFYRDNYETLTVYSRCNELQQNAVFRPAPAASSLGPSICLGVDDQYPKFAFAQDPSVFYHELGHAFVHLALNQRNENVFSNIRSSMGSIFYDEAGAINEGIADYFSYLMTGRPFLGEWAMHKIYKSARQLTENLDAYLPNHPIGDLHVSNVTNTSQGRLDYLTYLQYNPNEPTEPIETKHYAGQIISHFLFASTQMLINRCNMTTKVAQNNIIYFVSETLGEIGDLSSTQSDFFNDIYAPVTGRNSPSYANNLAPYLAYEMSTEHHVGNYYRFVQTFARYFNKKIVNQKCLFNISKSDFERLLDDYGLLIFRTYNDDYDKTNAANNSLNGLTSVDINNRIKSTLVTKDFIRLPLPGDIDGKQTAYVFDDQFSIPNILENLAFKGSIVTPSNDLAGVEYNNDNNKISPGEIVAVVLNIVNESNSTMGGVQVLGTPWDHMRKEGTYYKPCSFNDFPLSSQGAASTSNPQYLGSCGKYPGQDYVDTDSNGIFDADLNGNGTIAASEMNFMDKDGNLVGTNGAAAETAGYIDRAQPVCFIEKREENETTWVSQNEYRKDMALSDSDCLGHEDSLNFNPNECLLRLMPGARHAYFSKINAKKTWAETIQTNSNIEPTFNSSNAVLMEVNKWIPPGTTFNCRFRARFTNCDDCYHDTANSNDNFIEHEFLGPTPFKIINFKFTVID